MKKLFVLILLAAFALNAQTESKINKNMRSPKNIRSALRGIKTDSATVSGDRTFTGVVSVDSSLYLESNEQIQNDTDGDVVVAYDDDAATLGEWVWYCNLDDSVFADNDLWYLHFRSLDEDSTAVNDWVTVESKILDATGHSKDSHFAVKTYEANTQKTITFAGDAITLPNGGEISNPHADTLKITETVTKVNKLALSAAPTLGIEDITLHASASGAERVLLTIGGVDYILVAAADSADYAD